MKFKEFQKDIYEIKDESMNVPLRIFASKEILNDMKNDKTIQQGIDMAKLPSVFSHISIMPDGHQGYGFPIGGVAAFDYEDGIILPGGVGFDINCGVALIKTNLFYDDVKDELKNLSELLYNSIPSGLGVKTDKRSKAYFEKVIEKGLKSVAKKEDYSRVESYGSMKTTKEHISNKAYKRGITSLGTLGSGNHFVEIQKVENVYQEISQFGLKKNQIVFMVHSGSRGFGHQIAKDYLEKIEKKYPNMDVFNKNLRYVKFDSELGQQYFSAMKAAANFAWVNRYLMVEKVRDLFVDLFGVKKESMEYIYDVSHNVAKVETHDFGKFKKKLIVHRKGATRAYPAGEEELCDDYKEIGQPVIIPGSMGTSSYLLVAKDSQISFKSSAHGAGRLKSRSGAKRELNYRSVKSDLDRKGIIVRTSSKSGLLEEAPDAYKDIDEVIKVNDEIGLSKKYARFFPLVVVKG
ncbi:MAG: RtcB family protein [Candidatus Woesearchaeota archaeon]